MKRLVAVFLIASPAWIASGVAGWWLGGGRSQSLPAAAEFASKPAPAAPSQPVQHPLVRMETAAPKAGVPVAPPPPHAAPNLAMTAPPPQPKIIAPPPPPRAPAPEPIASLGSTDVSAPEQALASAPAETATASKEGVLIVVSLASQKAFVFKDGELWG